MRLPIIFIFALLMHIALDMRLDAQYNDYSAYILIKNTDFNYTISTINSSIKQSDSYIKMQSSTFARFSENATSEFIIFLPTNIFNIIYNNILASFKNEVKFKLVLKRINSDDYQNNFEDFSSIVQNDYYYSRNIQKEISNESKKQFFYLFFNTEDTTIQKGVSYIKIIWLYDSYEDNSIENSAFAPEINNRPMESQPNYSREIEYLESIIKTQKTKNYPKKPRKSKIDTEKEYRDIFFTIP